MASLCTLIVNPASGGYSGEKLKKVLAALESGGFDPEVHLTKKAGDATRIARRICLEREGPLLVACGGDGTVNEVINGIEPGKATLAVLPLGTANVLARELEIEGPDDAVARVVRGETRPLTIGLLEAGELRCRFLLMAGIGLDGFIVQGVRKDEKRIMGKGAYILSALRLLLNWERERMEVNIGGRRIDCHSLVVCNAARYGGGFILAPGAELFAPRFRVLCMTADTRRAYLRLVMSVISGRVSGNRDAVFIDADEVVVSGKKAIQVDGDYCCRAPVRITAHGAFARLVV